MFFFKGRDSEGGRRETKTREGYGVTRGTTQPPKKYREVPIYFCSVTQQVISKNSRHRVVGFCLCINDRDAGAQLWLLSEVVLSSVADPYLFDTDLDPDPGCEKILYGSGSRANFDTDPDPG